MICRIVSLLANRFANPQVPFVDLRSTRWLAPRKSTRHWGIIPFLANFLFARQLGNSRRQTAGGFEETANGEGRSVQRIYPISEEPKMRCKWAD